MKPLVLLVARIFLGLSFLVFGWAKVSGEPVFGDPAAGAKSFSQFFPQFVQNSLDHGHPFWFWRPVLEVAVRPAPGVFAFCVAWGEFLLGLSLLLGALVVPSAVGGIGLLASIQFCDNPFAREGPLWTKVGGLLEHGSVALLLLILAANGAGRFFGLDGIVFREQGKGPSKSGP